jgi:hypothetical protein
MEASLETVLSECLTAWFSTRFGRLSLLGAAVPAEGFGSITGVPSAITIFADPPDGRDNRPCLG